jgi:hypothetical protein
VLKKSSLPNPKIQGSLHFFVNAAAPWRWWSHQMEKTTQRPFLLRYLCRSLVSPTMRTFTVTIHQDIVQTFLGRHWFTTMTNNMMSLRRGQGKHFFSPESKLCCGDLSVLGLKQNHEYFLIHCVGKQGLFPFLGREREQIVIGQH